MKRFRGLGIYGLLIVAGMITTGEEASAGAGCEIETIIINGFETNIRITKAEIGGPNAWRPLWQGETKIIEGKAVKKTVNAGTSCTTKLGQPRKWNIRYTRKNGKTHTCTGIAKESKHQLEPGGGCEVRNRGGS